MSVSKKIAAAARNIIYGLSPRKKIILESLPDFADNTREVFDEMLRRKLNEKYDLIWLSKNEYENDLPKIRGVGTVVPSSLRYHVYVSQAKAIISCNALFGSHFKKQFSVYLEHGAPLKDTGYHIHVPDTLTYYLTNSEGTIPVRQRILRVDNRDLFVPLGYPRNDAFAKPPADVRDYIKTGFEYDKAIIWYPTFRNHKNGETYGGHPLPIIHDGELAKELNECAAANRTVIILKPHFAQDLSYIKKLKLSNIIFIDDDFYKTNRIKAYDFLNACDALLTDYSSVYYDFTLAEKPIGLIWEDLEEYKSNPGLIDEYEEWTAGGVKIYGIEDLKSFISDVANGRDILKSERERIRDFVNYSTDGKNTERVVDFIIEKAGL